jgi:hypothetical protein
MQCVALSVLSIYHFIGPLSEHYIIFIMIFNLLRFDSAPLPSALLLLITELVIDLKQFSGLAEWNTPLHPTPLRLDCNVIIKHCKPPPRIKATCYLRLITTAPLPKFCVIPWQAAPLGWGVIASRTTLKDHPSSAVRDCVFNTFAAALHNLGAVFSICNSRMRWIYLAQDRARLLWTVGFHKKGGNILTSLLTASEKGLCPTGLV